MQRPWWGGLPRLSSCPGVCRHECELAGRPHPASSRLQRGQSRRECGAVLMGCEERIHTGKLLSGCLAGAVSWALWAASHRGPPPAPARSTLKCDMTARCSSKSRVGGGTTDLRPCPAQLPAAHPVRYRSPHLKEGMEAPTRFLLGPLCVVPAARGVTANCPEGKPLHLHREPLGAPPGVLGTGTRIPWAP